MKHNYWKRTLAGVMALALTVGAVPTIPGGGLFKGTGTGITAYAADPISYLDSSGTTQSCTDYTVVTSSDKTVQWNGGWYVVKDNVTITTNEYAAIVCGGGVNLILCDGASLTVNVNSDGQWTRSILGYEEPITIYAQSTGSNMGVLTINNEFQTSGDVNIYGGSMNANAPITAYGNINIGGGSVSVTADDKNNQTALYAIGSITISGGTVEATGGRSSVLFSMANIMMSGGTVTATATSSNACGITANGGSMIISGGNLTASGSIRGNVQNSIPGTGWTDTAGTTGMTPIAVNTTGQNVIGYKKVQFPPAVYVTGVSLNKESTTLTVGDEETLTATVAPDDAADKTVTWASDNTDVATVDANGKVTAVGAGTANITATATNGTDNTADDKTATCAVTVAEQAVVSGGFVEITSADQVTIDNIGEAPSIAAVKNWLLENYEAIKASTSAEHAFDFCFKTGGNLYWYGILHEALNEEHIEAIKPDTFYIIANLQDEGNIAEVLAKVSEYLGYGDVVYFWEETAPAIDIADATLTFDKASFNYTGKAITPVMTVKIGDKTLTEGVDYEITADSTTSATEKGDYTVTIEGKGDYTGTATAIWQIVAPKQYSISVSNGTIQNNNGTTGTFTETAPVTVIGSTATGYWTDASGETVSHSRTYRFYAMYDTTLTWNATEEQTIGAVANIAISDRTHNEVTDKTTVKVTSTWELPKGAKVIEAGTLRAASTDTITKDDFIKNVATYLKKSTLKAREGTFYFNINLSAASVEKTIYAMTYVKYSYNGETQTLYSNMLTSAPTT